jgi:hypothetical protein
MLRNFNPGNGSEDAAGAAVPLSAWPPKRRQHLHRREGGQ